MRKAAAVLVCLLVLLAAGCRGSYTDLAGFQRLASMHISGRVYTCFSIDDEGVVILLEHEWTSEKPHGGGRSWCTPTVHRMHPDGRVESKELPTNEFAPVLTVEGNLVTLEDGSRVTYTSISTFSTRTLEDSRLAELINDRFVRSNGFFFDSGVVVYPIGEFEGVGIYDPSTGRDIDLFEEYERAYAVNVWDGCVIAGHSDEPYFLHVFTLDGEEKYRVPRPDSYSLRRVEGSALGVVYGGQRESPTHDEPLPVLEWYSFEGDSKVTYPLPDVEAVDGGQAPSIKIVHGEQGEVVVVTQSSLESIPDRDIVRGCAYIGYFDLDTGEEICYMTNDQQAVTFYPVEEAGRYYMHPTADGEKGGEIALFDYEEKIASMHLNGGLDGFAASPNGRFFAVVSGDDVSSFEVVTEAAE